MTYATALARKATWQQGIARLFDRVDVIAMPTVGFPAPLATAAPDMIAATMRLTSLCAPWSFAELPALSVPCGFEAGMPIGLQLVGPQWSEALLLACGAAYQDVTDFHRQRPPLLSPTVAGR